MKLDAGRLGDLRVFAPAELRPICLAAIGVITEQLDALEHALSKQDLPAAAEAAHRARNEALLMGARELSEALAVLESAAREREIARARESTTLARELWPETREAIAALAAAQDATG